MMRISLSGLLAAVAAALVLAPAASAAKVPCVPGTTQPKCQVWQAKIAAVDDGDTVQARIKKGRRWLKRQSIRITGIQAPELFSYSRKKGRRGYCLGVASTVALERLVNKRVVRLVAQKKSSKTVGEGRVRLRRAIQVKRGKRWIDPATILLRRGLALWFANSAEWAWNGSYDQLAQAAAARGKGVWNPTACGAGSSQAQQGMLRMKVKWDAQGTDKAADEWIRITNLDQTRAVPLSGWAVRDSHLRGDKRQPGYKFPSSAVVPAGGSIRVVVGRGSDTASTFYWGLGAPIFENVLPSKNIGDGAYLFDSRGNLRAHTVYPCRIGCSDPLAGKVSVTARYQGGIQPGTGQINEWVTIKNVSSTQVSLDEYELESVPWFYEFGPGDVLWPGQAIVVWVDRPYAQVPAAVGSRLRLPAVPGLPPFQDVIPGGFRSWNHRVALLADNKDVVALRAPSGAPVPGGCHAWGGVSCPSH